MFIGETNPEAVQDQAQLCKCYLLNQRQAFENHEGINLSAVAISCILSKLGIDQK